MAIWNGTILDANSMVFMMINARITESVRTRGAKPSTIVLTRAEFDVVARALPGVERTFQYKLPGVERTFQYKGVDIVSEEMMIPIVR